MNEFDIDDLLNESLRRRGASVQIGGGSIAEVHRRVVRRRRRLAGGVMVAVAIPTVVAAFALAGRDGSGRVASPGPAATEALDVPATRDVEGDVSTDCAMVVTSGSMVPMPPDQPKAVPNEDACRLPFPIGVPRPVPFPGGGWRCLGEPDRQEDGWSYYSFCEPTCKAITGVTPTVIDIADLPSTTFAERPSTTIVELPSTTVAEPASPTVAEPASTTIAEPASTIVEPATSVLPPTWPSVMIAVPEVAVCMSGEGSGVVIDGGPATTTG